MRRVEASGERDKSKGVVKIAAHRLGPDSAFEGSEQLRIAGPLRPDQTNALRAVASTRAGSGPFGHGALAMPSSGILLGLADHSRWRTEDHSSG